MRIGKIYGNGFYHTLFGDLIGYLEYIAGMEVKGVLGYKEFFTKTLFKDNEYVFSFRSPLVCPSEVNDIYIKTNLDNKYFGHFQGQDLVMTNMYDLSLPVQGRCRRRWRCGVLM